MSDSRAVLYEEEGPVAWMTINRPDKRNALNEEVRKGLFAGFQRFNASDTSQVLVLTGSGDVAFSAGADLEEMNRTAMRVPPRDFLPELGFNIDVPKLTIAAVNGYALAGGFLLAQNCDLCIASDNAQFGITEANVGRGFPWSVPLPNLMPHRVALEMLVTAETISAKRMYELGFINRVVPHSELRTIVQEFAVNIASKAPLTVRAAKETMRLPWSHSMPEAYAISNLLWEDVYNSADAQEGPKAFRERRKPVWQSR